MSTVRMLRRDQLGREVAKRVLVNYVCYLNTPITSSKLEIRIA